MGYCFTALCPWKSSLEIQYPSSIPKGMTMLQTKTMCSTKCAIPIYPNWYFELRFQTSKYSLMFLSCFGFFTIELMMLMQMIPIWWRWYYWADPASWTIYGLMASQLGDQVGLIHVPGQSDQTVKEFVEDFLGLNIDQFSLIVCLHLGIVLLFLFVYGFGIKHLNFQKRWWRKLHRSNNWTSDCGFLVVDGCHFIW